MNRYTLSEWSSLAQIGAAIGVMISLIFVAVELRNNTEVAQAAARDTMNQKDLDFISLAIDSSVLASAQLKAEDGLELSPLEESQVVLKEYINFVSFEHSFYQYQKGFLEKDQWDRHQNIMRGQLAYWPYARTMWEMRRHAFSKSFQDLVEGYISEES